MDQKIDVLVVEPGKEPRLSTVVDDLEHLQQIVGGPIEAGSYLPQRVMLICNGEGKNMGLPPNRPNPTDSGDTICGTFLLCSFEGEHLAVHCIPLHSVRPPLGFGPFILPDGCL